MPFPRQARQLQSEGREEQFLSYIQDTGLSQALQKAMILLYEMPVKPSNLEEYFAEYLENGAQDLVQLSLLKAELCFKHSETKSLHKRIKFLENQINVIKGRNGGRRSSKEFFDEAKGEDDEQDPLPLPPRDPLGTSYSLLDRFLGDLDGASIPPPPSLVEGTDSEEASRLLETSINTPGMDSSLIPIPTTSTAVLEGATGSKELEGGREEEECEEEAGQDNATVAPTKSVLEEKEMSQDEVASWRNEIKKIDPWGIVFSTNSVRDSQKNSFGFDFIAEAEMATFPIKTEQPQPPTSLWENFDRKFHTFDPDDAESLAEIYSTYANESLMLASHSRPHSFIRVNSQGDIKLSSEEPQPKRKSRIRDLMGWSEVGCTTEDELGKKFSTSGPQTPSSSLLYPEPDSDWAEFNTGVDPCLKEIDFYRDIAWQDDALKIYPKNAKDEAFLLDYEVSRVAQQLGKDAEVPGFQYQLHQPFGSFDESTKRGVCGGCNKWKRKGRGGGANGGLPRDTVEVATSTTELSDVCQCNDCDCEFVCEDGLEPHHSGSWMTKSPTSVPGKMSNWTMRYPEYSGEDDGSLGGVSGTSVGRSSNKQQSKKLAWKPKSSVVSQFLAEFENRLHETQSFCVCGDKSSTPPSSPQEPQIFQEECEDFCTADAVRNEDTLLGKPSLWDKQAEAEYLEIDPEMEKAFGGSTTAGEVLKASAEKNRRSREAEEFSTFQRISDAAENDEPKRASYVYEMDLESGIKRQFGIIDAAAAVADK